MGFGTLPWLKAVPHNANPSKSAHVHLSVGVTWQTRPLGSFVESGHWLGFWGFSYLPVL